MSENNTQPQRTRRRAVRSVGPPPEEGRDTAGSATGAVAVAVPAAASESTTDSAASAPSATSATSVAATVPAAASVDITKSSDTDMVGPVEPPDTSARNHSAARALSMVAAGIVVIVLVAGAVVSVLAVHANDQRDARRAEFVQTARQAIVNLTTIRADSAKDDIDRILSVATGEFKTEFDGRVNPFTDIVKQVNIVSTGEVVDTAVENDDENSARVLVAAKQTLTNAGEPQQQTRLYRFRVTVTKTDDGPKASKVEFVA